MQVDSLSVNPGNEGLPELMVSQPGCGYAILLCSWATQAPPAAAGDPPPDAGDPPPAAGDPPPAAGGDGSGGTAVSTPGRCKDRCFFV